MPSKVRAAFEGNVEVLSIVMVEPKTEIEGLAAVVKVVEAFVMRLPAPPP